MRRRCRDSLEPVQRQEIVRLRGQGPILIELFKIDLRVDGLDAGQGALGPPLRARSSAPRIFVFRILKSAMARSFSAMSASSVRACTTTFFTSMMAG